MMDATNAVLSAISFSMELIPEYFRKTLLQRLKDGAGSTFEQFSAPEELLEAVRTADWEEWGECPNLLPECRAFRAPIPGTVGIVNLETLPPETPVTLDDRKGTGTISCTVRLHALDFDPREKADFTVLLVGPERGHQVVFTLHPGAPVKPSSVKAEKGMHGKVTTAGEALEMGLSTAKAVW